MAKVKTNRGGANDSVFRDVINTFIDRGEGHVADVVEFAESPWGLNLKLTPVQRFMLKCFYKLPLDDTNSDIELWDTMRAHKLSDNMTEAEFAKWSFDTGRCNIDMSDPVNFGRPFYELLLVLGRRSGKSTLAGIIVNYEFYRLIKLGDPHAYYHLPPGDEIAVISAAPTDDQASIVFDKAQNFAMNSLALQKRLAHPTMTYFEIQTDNDLKIHGHGKKGSMTFITGGSSSNSIRGHNTIIIVIDEMAHFIENNGRFSIDEMHGSLLPSIANFKHPKTGGQEGKALYISSPYAHFGKFYNLYRDAFTDDGRKNGQRLVFKYHTALVNPDRVSEAFLKDQRRQDQSKFKREFGSEFDERITSWIDSEPQFRSNVRRPYRRERGKAGVRYFWAFDLGVTNNGTALAISHLTDEGRYCVDYCEVYYSGSSPVWEAALCTIYRDHPECAKWRAYPMLPLTDFARYATELERDFPMYKGSIDQFSGHAFYQLLHGAGLGAVELISVNEPLKCQIYQLFKDLYTESMLDLMDHPVLVPELLNLEAELRPQNKVAVSKRESTDGSFQDDISDATARSVWLCWSHHNGVAGPGGVNRLPAVVAFGGGARFGLNGVNQMTSPRSYNDYQRYKQLSHGTNTRRVVK